MNRLTLPEINALSQAEFVALVGPVFERSPWIAELGWSKRPFRNVEDLHRALCAAVANAGARQQEALIAAHPDLAGRLAQAGQLTRASAAEQAGAGLMALTAEELAQFQKYNAAYRRKFAFPFVICARLNSKDAILAGFQQRLQNSRPAEIKTALEEIFKIAELRLRDLITP